MRIAFVPPWYSADAPGGAEVECRRWVKSLRDLGVEVEVLTTCARDHSSDWNVNYFSPGVEVVDGVPVRRFPVRKRDTSLFDRINYKLLNRLPVTPEEERTFIEESIRSLELEAFIADAANDYYYVFIPYLFGTSYYGVMARPDRAYLIPCLHDEAYARLQPIAEMFNACRGCLYHTDAERRLASSLYRLNEGAVQSVVGEIVDLAWTGNAQRAREHFHLEGPYVLYVGRRDPTKNTPLLIEYFCRFRREHNLPLNLLLLGPGEIELPSDCCDGIVDGGFVPEQLKYDAYAGALALCQPSLNESFSLVIMESWLMGTPVLVHEQCAVTQEHTARANGGLWFSDYNDFAACLLYFLNHPHIRRRMGQLGRQYVTQNFSKERVLARFARAIGLDLALPS